MLPVSDVEPLFCRTLPVTLPLTTRLPPLLVTPLARLPLTVSPPALRMVPPLKVLMPLSVHVPVPFLTKPPVPEIVPEKVVLVLSLPVVSVAEPSVTLPLPTNEPIDWLNPASAKVAPDATLYELLAEKALATPACSVPILTKVP